VKIISAGYTIFLVEVELMWVQDPSIPLHLHEDFRPKKERKRTKKHPCYLYRCEYEPISLILIMGYHDAI